MCQDKARLVKGKLMGTGFQELDRVLNDGFLQNTCTLKTLFRLFQSTFRSLEMHSKRKFKICICLVILGEPESFRKLQGQ